LKAEFCLESDASNNGSCRNVIYRYNTFRHD
jgi:hypothetical protein